jgi:hypothetical protein
MAKEIIKTIKVTKEQNFSSDWLDDNYLVGVVHQECAVCSQHVDGFEPLYNAHSPLSPTHNSNLLSRYNQRVVGWDYFYQATNYFTVVGGQFGQYKSLQGPYQWHYKEKMSTPPDFIGDPPNVFEMDCIVDIDTTVAQGEWPTTDGKTFASPHPTGNSQDLSQVYGIYVRTEQLDTYWFATDFPIKKFNIEHAYSVRGKSRIVDENTARGQHRSVYLGANYYPTAIYMGEVFDVHDMLVSINAETLFDEEVMQASISQYPHRYNAVHELNEDKSFTFDKDDKQDLTDISRGAWAHQYYATRKGFFKIQKNGRHVYPLVVGVESVNRINRVAKKLEWKEWMRWMAAHERVTEEIQLDPPHGEGQLLPPDVDNEDKIDCYDLYYSASGSQDCRIKSLRHYPNGMTEGEIAENVRLTTFDTFLNWVLEGINKNIELGRDTQESITSYNEAVAKLDEERGTFFNPATCPNELYILSNGVLSPGISNHIFARNSPLDLDTMSWFLREYYGEEKWNQFSYIWRNLHALVPDSYSFSNFEKKVGIPEIIDSGSEIVLDPDGNPVNRETPVSSSGLYRLFSFSAACAVCPCSGLPIPLFFNGIRDVVNTVGMDLERNRRSDVGLSPENAHDCNPRKDMSAHELNSIAQSVEKDDVFRSLTPKMSELFVMPKNYNLNDIQFIEGNSSGQMGDNNGWAGPSLNGVVTDNNGNPMRIIWPCAPSPRTHSGEQTVSSARQTNNIYNNDYSARIDKFRREFNPFTGKLEDRAENIVLQGEKIVLGLGGVFPHNSDIRTDSNNFSESCEGVVQVNFYGGSPVTQSWKVNTTILGISPYGKPAGWMLDGNDNITFDTIPRENDDPAYDQFSLTANSWDMGKDVAINLDVFHSIEAFNHYPRILDINNINPFRISSEDLNEAFAAYLSQKYKYRFIDERLIFTGKAYLYNNNQSTHKSYEKIEQGKDFHQIPCLVSGYTPNNTYLPYSYGEFIHYRNLINPNLYFSVENKVDQTWFEKGDPDGFGNIAITQKYSYFGHTCRYEWYSLLPDAGIYKGPFGDLDQVFYSWPKIAMSNSTDDSYNIFLPVDRPWQVTFNHSNFDGRVLPSTGFHDDSVTTSHVNLVGRVQLPYYNHNVYGVLPQIIKDQDFCNGSNHASVTADIFESYSRQGDIIEYDSHNPRTVIIQNADTNLLSKSPLEIGRRVSGSSDDSNEIGSDDWTWYPTQKGFGGIIAPMSRHGGVLVENPFM